MSVIVRQVGDALAAAIHAAAPGLRHPPTVIAAVPSHAAEYPAAAISLERFTLQLHNEQEILVDDAGAPLIGSAAGIDGAGNLAELAAGVYLVSVGTIRGRGRIWVGARLAPKREELEEAIRLLFFTDDAAPGRYDATIRPRVAGYTLPFDWTVAVLLAGSEWSSEFAFSERLWAWIDITVDVPLLVPRRAPIASTLVLAVTSDISTAVATPDDLDALNPALEQHQVAADGTVAAYP